METVQITRPELPDTLPSDHQELMQIFYNHWQKLSLQVRDNNSKLDEDSNEYFFDGSIEGMLRAPTQGEIAAVMPAKVIAAVMLGNQNYQVLNGGWSQWEGNGFSVNAPKLAEIYDVASDFEIEGARDLHEMTTSFMRIQKEIRDDDDEEGCGYNNPYDDLDERYYEVDREATMQAILDRFDEIHGRILAKDCYRQAA